jgi:hypothetical protein
MLPNPLENVTLSHQSEARSRSFEHCCQTLKALQSMVHVVFGGEIGAGQQ